MKSSSDLFNLIKSLSVSEKGYFKKYASTFPRSNKNYLKLFNLIDKQKIYSKENITIDSSKDHFLKHLSTAKVRLFNLIMQSLESYYRKSNIESELKNSLSQINILLEKGFYNQCRKKLAKIKRKAKDLELHLIHLEAIQLEDKLMRVESFENTEINDIENKEKEHNEIMQTYNNLIRYRNVESKIFLTQIKEHMIRSRQEMEKYNKLIQHELLKDENNTLSFQAKIHFYKTHEVYNYTIGDFLKSYQYGEKAVILMQSNPNMIALNPHGYLSLLINLATTCSALQKYDELLKLLSEIKSLPQRFKAERLLLRCFDYSFNLEMGMYMSRGEFDKAAALIPAIEKGLHQFEGKLSTSNKLTLYYSIFYSCFGLGKFPEALKWMNKLLNNPDLPILSDIFSIVQVCNLVVHYELGNNDVLGYFVKSAYRFLYKKERLYQFETKLLNFIRKKLPKLIDQKDLAKAFKELKTELEEIIKDPFESGIIEYFDFISWLESKIENKPFAEIVKEKSR